MTYRLAIALHPLFHRGPHDGHHACWVCRFVWHRLEQDEELMASIQRGLEDIKAGRVHRWSDIRREL